MQKSEKFNFKKWLKIWCEKKIFLAYWSHMCGINEPFYVGQSPRYIDLLWTWSVVNWFVMNSIGVEEQAMF